MPLFDSDFLKQLEYLSLVSRRAFQGRLMAQRRTRQLGSGIEFADHREYTTGDDFRYLDWNVYARHEDMLLKRFQEEQDLHVYVLLDCSRSMSFGEPTKFDHARRVAAALAYIALADLDCVAVTAFADDLVADFPLTRGKGRILALLRFLEHLQTAGRDTDLARAAAAIVHRSTRRGPVIIVSDCYDPAGYRRGLDMLRFHKFEPHVIRVFDPSETDPNLLGNVELLDAETQSIRKVTVTERAAAQYRQLYADFARDLHTYCRNYGLGYTAADTSIPFNELILSMMRSAGVVK